MGTIYVSAIFTEVDKILLDVAKVRWPDATKLRYLNAGQRQMVIFKPDVYTLTEVYRLVAGTKQSVPDGTSAFQTPAGATIEECIQFIRLVRNMTVVSNMVASWTNVSFDTFVSSGADITSAITAAGADTATVASIALTKDHSYRLECVLILNSGDGPTLTGTNGFPPTALVAGSKNIDFTATGASLDLTASNAAAGDWECTFFLWDMTTYPSLPADHVAGGPAITLIGMDIMDAYNPDWHSDTPSATVKNYIFEDDDADFYVTPPQPVSGPGYVEAVFSAVPADVVAVTGPPVTYASAITISDVYRDQLVNYILYRCYAEDAAISPFNAQRATEYWNLFVLGLERKDLVRKEWSPNMKKPNPSTE